MRYFLLIATTALAIPVSAQSVDLAVDNTGISFGDSEEFTGLRFNYRDRRLRKMTGMNVTLWTPYQPARSEVAGVAVGLPATGARNFQGLGIGIFGVGADETLEGIMLGGLGAGAGQDMEGLAIGGLGAGAGRDVRGIFIGGLGAGAGGDAVGLFVGGLGVGAGGDARGIMIGGIGAGAGRDLVGLSFGGIGVGAGNLLQGIHVAGLAAGAPNVRGLILAGLAAGGQDVRGAIWAPAYFKIEEDGYFRGVSVSAFNHIKGEQNGLTIGILNWARHLNGVQIGLLNYAGNKRKARWLPIVNVHHD